jgi:hypothetical protein
VPGTDCPAAFWRGGGVTSQTLTSGRAAFPTDLSVLSTDQLLRQSDRCYSQLDCDHPDAEALMHYYALIEELAAREATTASRTGP